MKKIAAILLVGAMTLGLTACGSSKPAETTAAQTAAESAAAATIAADSETGELTGRLKTIQESGVLKVATSPDYPPYEFEDIAKDGQDKYVGADIELAKYIAEKLGVKLQVEAMAFDSCLAAVSEGRVDMTLCGMVPKEERRNSMEFSDVYYNDGQQQIVILKKDAEKYKTLADFAGQNVAAQNGSLQYQLVTEQLKDVKCEQISAVTDGIMMLKTGKVAGIALASVAAGNYINNDPEMVVCAENFDYTPLGTVAGLPKKDPEFLARVNEIVKEVVDSGVYYTWIDEASALSNEIQGMQ